MNTLLVHPTPRRVFGQGDFQRGISLIETMVGMTLGLVVVLIIVQVWGGFVNQKQITASGAQGQANGLLALTVLEQDIRSAGAGLTKDAAFNCTTIYSYFETAGVPVSPVPAYSGSMGMAPVEITNGGNGSDTLTIKRSSDPLGAIPATLTSTMPQSSSDLNLSSVAGFAAGDIVLAVGASGGSCTVMQVTHVQGAALKLKHDPGDPTTYNPTVLYQNTNAWPAYVSGDLIMKVGQMIAHQYTVNASNQLVLTDLTLPGAPTTSVVSTDIVKIKAQYGIANVNSQDVNAWISPTVANGWATLDGSEVKRIKAIRLVIVARVAKKEAWDVTGSCTSTSPYNTGPCAWIDSVNPPPPIDLSSNSDWKKYRYRIYQTIIPIRNVIWANV